MSTALDETITTALAAGASPHAIIGMLSRALDLAADNGDPGPMRDLVVRLLVEDVARRAA